MFSGKGWRTRRHGMDFVKNGIELILNQAIYNATLGELGKTM
jgi:hypothetical protein